MFIVSVHEKCIFESSFYAFQGEMERKTMQDLRIAIFIFRFSWAQILLTSIMLLRNVRVGGMNSKFLENWKTRKCEDF